MGYIFFSPGKREREKEKDNRQAKSDPQLIYGLPRKRPPWVKFIELYIIFVCPEQGTAATTVSDSSCFLDNVYNVEFLNFFSSFSLLLDSWHFRLYERRNTGEARMVVWLGGANDNPSRPVTLYPFYHSHQCLMHIRGYLSRFYLTTTHTQLSFCLVFYRLRCYESSPPMDTICDSKLLL